MTGANLSRKWPPAEIATRASQISCCCDGTLPPRRRFGSEDPQRRSGDQVALKVEIVMDCCVHVEKALGRTSRLEPLHFTLSSSHHLMGVFRAIVLPQPLLMRAVRRRCRKGIVTSTS